MSPGDNVEIERKFLLCGDGWRAGAAGTRYRQGYLCCEARATVRVRVGGGEAWLAIKGATRGLTRAEYEYAIPVADGEALLQRSCLGELIDKTRYRVAYGAHVWEIDEFHGNNHGLVVAEVELDDESERPVLPPWIGTEVSDDPRYTNACLAQKPYRAWGEGDASR